jgi:hypothetical protein
MPNASCTPVQYMDLIVLCNLGLVLVLYARGARIYYIVQRYAIPRISSFIYERPMLRVVVITNLKRSFHVQLRACFADHATWSAHKATKHSVTDHFAQDRADRWDTGGKNSDLNLDEGSHTRCSDANWEELVNVWLWLMRRLTTRVHDLLLGGKFGIYAYVRSDSASSNGSWTRSAQAL